jgi:methylated-DNA-[protein]-cysteine S-methyltransferase
MKQSETRTDQSKESIMVESPLGVLIVTAQDGDVCSIALAKDGSGEAATENADSEVLRNAARELNEYFAGKRTEFTFPMRAEGTPFQQKVWQALREIPLGQTRAYGEIAGLIGQAKASRAVGMACNRNPIMIAVPCHRVVGAKGALVGYAYGTDTKQKLLTLERESLLT